MSKSIIIILLIPLYQKTCSMNNFAVSGAEERSVIKSKETVSPALQEKGGEEM